MYLCCYLIVFKYLTRSQNDNFVKQFTKKYYIIQVNFRGKHNFQSKLFCELFRFQKYFQTKNCSDIKQKNTATK